MLKENFKKMLLNSIIISANFLSDRISKIYILKKAELESGVDIYLTPYLNLYLIWNKGIAFGHLSVNESFVYSSISGAIALIILIVLATLIKSHGLKRYSLTFLLGVSAGNLFDRIYYTAVPDFIDHHINNLHWFIFNVADIFITTGIICLIYVEIFFDKEKNENHY